jgi:hypothetical protein
VDKLCNQLQGLFFRIFPEAFFTNIGKPTFYHATILWQGKIFRQKLSGNFAIRL